MKLRIKLFIPLLLFSLLFGLYFRFLWLPATSVSMLRQSERNWDAHLTSVAEGLIVNSIVSIGDRVKSA